MSRLTYDRCCCPRLPAGSRSCGSSDGAFATTFKERGTETLIGIRIRIASNVDLKALDVSESYLLETIAPKQHGLVSICHALVLLIQLMLHPVKTFLYYDANQMDDSLCT